MATSISFTPLPGDYVIKADPKGGGTLCGQVKQVWPAPDNGQRLYLIQFNRPWVKGEGPDYYTQEEVDGLGFHKALKEEWQADRQRWLEWLMDRRIKLDQ